MSKTINLNVSENFIEMMKKNIFDSSIYPKNKNKIGKISLEKKQSKDLHNLKNNKNISGYTIEIKIYNQKVTTYTLYNCNHFIQNFPNNIIVNLYTEKNNNNTISKLDIENGNIMLKFDFNNQKKKFLKKVIF